MDVKPDQSLSTPSTIKDLQALIDQTGTNNIGTIALNTQSDEYYLLPADFNSASVSDDFTRKLHIWNSETDNPYDWQFLYRAILQVNTVLDHIEAISSEGIEQEWNNIKGQALFFRAFHFFQIAQLYAPQYDPATSANDLGIPLRLNSNVNIPSNRSTVEETYNQILSDLNLAATLLSPNNIPTTPLTKSRPSLAAVYGLLARVYLQIGNYSKARENADLCLQQYSTLKNYNDFSSGLNSAAVLFQRFETEVIFYASSTSSIVNISVARVDSALYSKFDSSDIRKYVFFRKNADNTYRFKGTYNGVISDLFVGIATDEVYLIRAESNARLGNISSAMSDLNTLLAKRYMNTVPFVPITASSETEALTKILLERRKELMYREIRWSDLRRLNKDNRFAITLKRIVGNQTYTLPPNDPRYTLLIPQTVINLSKVPQNPR